jgi:uncharacterized protein (DUF1499 family)
MPRGLLFALVVFVIFTSCSGNRPANLGINEGKLAPCPESPNCVSSQSTDKKHFIDPLSYDGSLAEAWEKLVSIIQTMKRSQIISQEDTYIYAEFTSALFRFVDDVEFYFDDTAKTIHMRSASRVGYSDLGVNRKRIETIRSKFTPRTGAKE